MKKYFKIWHEWITATAAKKKPDSRGPSNPEVSQAGSTGQKEEGRQRSVPEDRASQQYLNMVAQEVNHFISQLQAENPELDDGAAICSLIGCAAARAAYHPMMTTDLLMTNIKLQHQYFLMNKHKAWN